MIFVFAVPIPEIELSIVVSSFTPPFILRTTGTTETKNCFEYVAEKSAVITRSKPTVVPSALLFILAYPQPTMVISMPPFSPGIEDFFASARYFDLSSVRDLADK